MPLAVPVPCGLAVPEGDTRCQTPGPTVPKEVVDKKMAKQAKKKRKK